MTMSTSDERSAAALRALRTLDPATTTALTEEQRRRADATLGRILADPWRGARPARTRRRRPRARVLIPAAVLAATAVVLPLSLHGGSAFASWSPDPVPLSPADAAAAEATCRANFAIPDDPPMHLAVGERRGGWTYVLLAGPGGEATCLMPDDRVRANPEPGGIFGGYGPEHPVDPTPPRDGIVEVGAMGGAYPRQHGWRAAVAGWFGGNDEWIEWISGYAGPDVTAVTVHLPIGRAIRASLQHGRFSAWWPAGSARSDNPVVRGAWTYSYTVTLTDGSTRNLSDAEVQD